MIKSFELVYKELEELFIHKLPEYIEKINVEHNDGVILKPFQNTKLDDVCLRLPCFKFSLEESEYSEKDRVIENSVLFVSFEIKQDFNSNNSIITFLRHIEAINKMFDEIESDFHFKITEIKQSKITIKIIQK